MDKKLTSSGLKLVALITMLIDHTAYIFYNIMLHTGHKELYSYMRLIGRISFPIFIFMLVYGAEHTRNIKRYLMRLLGMAVISEIPFNLMTGNKIYNPDYQNVMFTLFIGLCCIAFSRYISEKYSKNRILSCFLVAFITCAGMKLADILRTDYSWIGVLTIMLAYLFRNKKKLQMPVVCTALILYNFSEVTTLFCIPLINACNGQKGQLPKWGAYFFYPAHIMLIWGIYQKMK